MNNGDRIICRGCGTEDKNQQDKCAMCRKPLYAERIERYMPLKPARKELHLNSFLKENLHLFTIIGVFGALSFYLTSLIPKNTNNILSNTQNLSGTFTFFINESTNSSIVISKLVNGSFIGTGFHPYETLDTSDSFLLMEPTYALQIGIIISYSLFFIFILTMLFELSNYEECLLMWTLFSLFILLVIATGIYLINTYGPVILALCAVAIALIVMIGERLVCNYIFSNEHATKKRKWFYFGILFALNIAGILILLAIMIYLMLNFQHVSHVLLLIGFAVSVLLGLIGAIVHILVVTLDSTGGIFENLKCLVDYFRSHIGQ